MALDKFVRPTARNHHKHTLVEAETVAWPNKAQVIKFSGVMSVKLCTNHFWILLSIHRANADQCLCYGCRIQITVSLSRGTNTELPEQNIFPLYVLLATPTSNISLEGVSLPFF